MPPEVRAFEYATGLFAVLIGLAVVDIATSFHRLLNSEKPVRWDPLALMAAFYALCLVVAMWFDLWGVRNFGATRHFPFYLSLIAQFFFLFLIAAASLPDDPSSGADLREYYSRKRRKLWVLIFLFHAVYAAAGLYFARGDSARLPHWILLLAMVMMFAPVAISAMLVLVKSRVAHYIGLGLLLAILALHYGQASIS
jgi:hypothetical protein